uniref:Uncharacterized protein n=1 Tax=Anguilla anguilla TaxID=7936 RepID=A0A0E9T637_ANGAN
MEETHKQAGVFLELRQNFTEWSVGFKD